MHDSSACLLKNGEIIAFAEEERFNREKHTGKFPENAVKYCLKKADIDIKQVAYVGFFWNPWKGIIKRILNLIVSFDFDNSRIGDYASNFYSMLTIPYKLRFKYGFRGRFCFISHHEAHIAAAYFLSPFKDAAVVSIDGTGEIDTVLCKNINGNSYKTLSRSTFPNSLGFFYGAMVEFLGFKMHSDEGKVMGLASYGETIYYDIFKKLISVNDDGVLKVDAKYLNFNKKDPLFNNKLAQSIGSKRDPSDLINERHENIASSAQKVFEHILLDILKYIRSKTSTDNICLNGGIFLNCSANGRVAAESGFKNIFIFPIANDAGTSIGAAYYVHHRILKIKERYELKHISFGPAYSDSDIETALNENRVKYSKPAELHKTTAAYLADNKIIGWFQGAMEAGPRALGNRSILASPLNATMKDTLNEKVKHRESFRPFAPAVLFERKDEYFEMEGKESPYMLYSFKVKEESKHKIPAVIHVDGTARVQTVKYDNNPLLYSLIKEFDKITGVPVIINTSFNVQGEPIVCSPEDAIRCFLNTKIDVLCIGSYVVEK